ncbi:MAG TPA: S9 family peptidase [Vicinamibacterales bacterium]|nr:S9 family peptidase [Vicinamibacterales bacterium]
MFFHRSRHVAAIAAFAFLVTAPVFAQKRGITERDLFRFVWVADPQISPDGTRVAFVRVTVNEKTDQYESGIWLAYTDRSEPPRLLTAGTRDANPRWSPDGTRLAFVRVTEEGGRSQPSQIYVIAMRAGEARAITEIPRGASNPQWSPDGRTIAFASTAKLEDLKKAEEEKKEPADKGDAARKDDGKENQADKPRESDVRVITSAVYRANGVADFGYVDPDRTSHIWTVAVPDGNAPLATPVQVTSGEFAENNFKWSPDGSRIFFISNRVKESYYFPNDTDLYSVAAGGGEPARVASIDGTIGNYAFAPDGKGIAFVGTLHGSPVRSYSQSDLWVADLPGFDGQVSMPRNLTAAYDFDIDGGLSGDQRSPRGASPSGPVWTRDGRAILIKVAEQGDVNIKRIDLSSGKVDAVTAGHQDILSYTADDAAQKVALVFSSQTVLGDVRTFDAATGTMTTLTTFNDELFKQVTLSEPEEIWYTSFDGKRIQGWILKPADFDSTRKYPMILQIHGGPHAAYGNTFTHEFQWMAAKGYVVLFTNPRGSSNYGQDFGNIIQFKYPGDDYKDLMAGVDEILKRGYVDENRMGVTGGSGGGLLTNWVVTQTERFKAAVSQRDISDWTNFWYTSDFWLANPTWFRKPPFEDPTDFAQRSPITHVKNITTPLMFILGDEDWRTPPSAGGEQLFRALKFLKRETVMVRFPDENHELSRSGKPWHRVERLQHIVGWMDKWLTGKD